MHGKGREGRERNRLRDSDEGSTDFGRLLLEKETIITKEVPSTCVLWAWKSYTEKQCPLDGWLDIIL